MTNYYVLKSGHREFFPYWDQEDLISIGWTKAAELVYEGASDETIRNVIDENYG